MTTLLVANRGEIARRIFRTARRMGMRTVAVYSEADNQLPFVREADAAIPLGPPAPVDSYLAIERVVAAAREAHADLVHPGYGFLAESPELAHAVTAAGMRFVGPPAAVMKTLGDKAEAKRVAESAGVPVLPGYAGDDQGDVAFLRAAASVGYPVMVKPVGGGGGIGMQAANDERELREALARARRLAASAFGDERLLLEPLVDRPRHVEVQIVADQHGSVAHVGDRDCSLQRRHQKIVEESPAPHVDPKQRSRMHDCAVRVARAAGYQNAGTVEFAVDARGDFFFLEVNARLQVEHPVTELVWSIDLVEQQLRVALGDRLAFESSPHGAAIEARIYAEDPSAGFLPSTGRLVHVHWPDDVRVDAGYEEGDVVTPYYDPLVAKLIASGDDRDTALAALARAVSETEILGARTNLALLAKLLGSERVRDGRPDTGLVERDLPNIGAMPPAPDEAYALAAVAIVERARDRRDPWTTSGPWRAGGRAATTVMLRERDRERPVRLEGTGPYVFGGHAIAKTQEPHRFIVDGEPGAAAGASRVIWTAWRGSTWMLDTAPRERSVETVGGAEVVAPMPGVIVGVIATANAPARRGDLLFVVEAMKMELRVEAPDDGTVRRILVREGQLVDRGQRLAEFEAAAD